MNAAKKKRDGTGGVRGVRRQANQPTIEETVARAKSVLTKDKATLEHFIRTYQSPARNNQTVAEYIRGLRQEEASALTIGLDEIADALQNPLVASKEKTDAGLLDRILKNTSRYIMLLRELCYTEASLVHPTDAPGPLTSSIEAILYQRRQRGMQFPVELAAPFEVYLVSNMLGVTSVPRSFTSVHGVQSLRSLKADRVGSFVRVRGIVTRSSDVRPLARIVTYVCDVCKEEVYQRVLGTTFMPQIECVSKRCQKEGRNGTLLMQQRASRFVKVQEIRIQEMIEEVPMGSTPRAVSVRLEGTLVQTCGAGDVVVVEGVYLPEEFVKRKEMNIGFVSETFLLAQAVVREKKSYEAYQASDEALARITTEVGGLAFETFFGRVAESFAPEIYGMVDVKKALVAAVVGAPGIRSDDGTGIRGDINVLLVGEPGVAKSQLLRGLARVAPRSIYTTGKGSSGAGLTAAVLKDPLTKEWVLEGGALVLADQGLCCIDEFDKMDETDRSAIYEVMEQQSISIAKAGITTTLNARVTIVAAANPKEARYNEEKSVAENINLPAALVSRFDMVFVLIDKTTRDWDRELARFVCSKYMEEGEGEERIPEGCYDVDFLRGFIAHARTFEPRVGAEHAQFIADKYVEMRRDCHAASGLIVTPRSLLAIIRVAQAVARIRFSNTVSREDIEVAMRLAEAARGADAGPDDEIRRLVGDVFDLSGTEW